jgi:hypothetical protein
MKSGGIAQHPQRGDGPSSKSVRQLRWLRVVAGRGTDLQVIMGLLKS